jgi:hypothetical protein
MKPLELMKQGGQLPRSKPPVEQRVKVMGTLDKKMQTILDREDLSGDERLKLYDQSFTRYLNVYDDYRPRPVAIAPEPVKRPVRRRNFGKRTKNNEGQGTTLVEKNEEQSRH